MPDLQLAYQYVIDACNDPYIGYSIPDRETGTLGVTYRTYFDCSSLMSKAMTVGGYFTSNPWFSTNDQVTFMNRAGWVEMSQDGQWLPGDILWYPPGWKGHPYGHTEMVFEGGTGRGKTMGAHTNSYAFPAQVSIRDTYTSAGYYSKLFRDPTGTAAAYKWHQSNTSLDEYGPDMTANAFMVWKFFNSLGFTAESIAGLLGNMQAESGINPGRWQGGTGPGYGLVQWDPASKYRNWATGQGIDMDDADQNGEGQCTYVNMCEQVGQWGPNSSHGYTYTWAEFSQLTNVDTAVLSFLWQFERPSEPHTENRLIYAAHWYSVITSGVWHGDGGRPTPEAYGRRAAFINDLQRRLVIPGRH